MSRLRVSLLRVMVPVGLAILLIPAVVAKKNFAPAPSGRAIYMDHCAACHGEDGQGNGPAVGALKFAPADLTLLAKRNGGTFPTELVKNIVGDWIVVTAHGSREMPIWGEVFRPKTAAEQQAADERFKAFVAFLESIQQ